MAKPSSLSLSEKTSILNKIKESYLFWTSIIPHVPKSARYTIGARIENKFLDLLEFSYTAYFTEKEKKTEKVLECISILDTLKFLLYVAWEAKFVSHKAYENLALSLDSAGKMFGGWRKNLDILQKKTPAAKSHGHSRSQPAVIGKVSSSRSHLI